MACKNNLRAKLIRNSNIWSKLCADESALASTGDLLALIVLDGWRRPFGALMSIVNTAKIDSGKIFIVKTPAYQ